MQLSNLPTRGKLILEQNKNIAREITKGIGNGDHAAEELTALPPFFLPSRGGFLDASRHVAFRTRPPKLPRVKIFPLKLVFRDCGRRLLLRHAGKPGRPLWSFPMCAVSDDGADNVNWDCEYETVDACRPAVLAGNRGFCALNPYWRPYPAPN